MYIVYVGCVYTCECVVNVLCVFKFDVYAVRVCICCVCGVGRICFTQVREYMCYICGVCIHVLYVYAYDIYVVRINICYIFGVRIEYAVCK